MNRFAPPFAGAAGLVLAIAAIINRDYPWVGHDYRYFIPRLIDTGLHIRLNGPAVQWYTPTFGGGLPAFPNPQHLQYSLVQLLALLMNPWTAIIVTTALVTATGYAVLYRFSRSTLELSPISATLCALFFVGNGFFIEHLIVGHLGFQLFPLGAAMLSVVADRRRPVFANGAVLALIISAMLHQAGFYLIIVLALSLLLTLPLVACYRPQLVEWRRVLAIAGVAVVLAAGISGSKVYAALALMRQFPREAADVYHIGVGQALVGLIAQLAGVMVLAPLFALVQVDPSRVSGALMKLTGADVRAGIWEVDTGLSPVLIAALVVGLVWHASAIRAGSWRALRPAQKGALAILILATWIVTESTLARGLVYPLIKQLPVISSLHVNHRLAAAFVLPLSILGAILIDRWRWRAQRPLASWALIALSTAAPLAYFLLPATTHLRTFDATSSIEASDLARRGERFEVAAILDADDAGALVAHASSLRPYEPLFGYANEHFAARVHIGDVHDVTDGYLNMTNASSLVFPEANNVRPFERIAASDLDALEAFVSRRNPAWNLPEIQKWLNRATLPFLILGIMLAVMGFKRGAAAIGSN